MSKRKETSEEIQQLLKTVVDHFDREDASVRERQILTWRRLKLLWEGFTQTWYSEVAHDWRVWDESQSDESEQSAYDKPINVFRAYLESIIAALSVTIPPIKCFPDNADDTLDLSTARAGDKIGKLIYRHNDVTLLWIHSLFIFCTEGMVGCYNYSRSAEEYGTYENKSYADEVEQHQMTNCPNCGHTMDDQQMTPEMAQQQEQIKAKLSQYEDEFQPDNPEIQNAAQEPDLCPACMELVTPLIQNESLVVTRLVGITKEPKSRVCLESYGGLNIKVANYARKQADTPYLLYSYETHYANAMERFEHLLGKKNELIKKISSEVGPHDSYEQWGRLSPQYQGEYPENTVTIRNCWLRPAAFNILEDPTNINKLKTKYPNGVKVTLVNDLFGEACNEELDDAWTLTYNPLSDSVHHDPLGLLLVSIQEITNDLISLTLQTIEHGIPQTFADPGVLNFDAYRQMEAVPGGIYEAIPKSGKTVGEAFHEVKTATLSTEIMPFSSNIQSLAQLVSGALPSLFGGQVEGGSGTASEYSMSRAQALQRLQSTWKMFTIWWKQIFSKAIPMYIKETREQDDERDVQRDTDGNFINVLIRKAELEGKIGKVELEANENLPLTWNQQKDIWMKLLEAANPEIVKIVSAPENLPILREALGLSDIYIPGEDDKDKQYDEIKLLLNSEPIPNPNDMDGTIPEIASIDIEPEMDNHEIEFEICRKWIISEAGRQTKTDNERGYQNVLLHAKAHQQVLQAQMMQQMQAQAQGDGAAPSKKPKKDMKAPIQGESDVATT